MSGLSASQAVLQLLACKCRNSCKEHSCVCLMNRIKCSELCSLKNCKNPSVILEANEESDSDISYTEDADERYDVDVNVY